MQKPVTREDCIELLCSKAEEIGAVPKRSDFDEYAVVKIKGFFGPWPRALEAAGLKEKRCGDRLEKNREKRRRAKARTNAKKRSSQGTKDEQQED